MVELNGCRFGLVSCLDNSGVRQGCNFADLLLFFLSSYIDHRLGRIEDLHSYGVSDYKYIVTHHDVNSTK